MQNHNCKYISVRIYLNQIGGLDKFPQLLTSIIHYQIS